jgi:Arc/MetJ-type ribon-helix-helix transcriptional regulator
VERLRAEIAKGEASGIAEDFDWDEFRARKWAEHAAKP